MSKLLKIKRYNYCEGYDGEQPYSVWDEDETGDWMKAEEALPVLEKLWGEREALLKACQQLVDCYYDPYDDFVGMAIDDCREVLAKIGTAK